MSSIAFGLRLDQARRA